MQTHDHRTNAAVARVNARIKHARVGLAETIDSVFVENSDDFV